MNHVFPLIKEIAYQVSLDVFARFASDEWAIYLDSAKITPSYGKYSIIAIEPFHTLTSKNGLICLDNQEITGDPFTILETYLNQYPLVISDQSLPFYGGVLGYFAYDLCHHLEKLTRSACDDMAFDDLAVGFYDLVFIFDEVEKKAWIISSGYPEQDADKRREKAMARYHYALAKLALSHCVLPSTSYCQRSDIDSNFSKEEYHQAVARVIDYIYAGDIFQANLSQRFRCALPDGLTAFQLYCRLRALNPAAFAAYLHLPNNIIASASPERFLKLTNKIVESCPIKGTRPRHHDPKIDKELMQALVQSEKDRAENVMIVDLVRNDLSRVCNNHSVIVPRLCGIESYATVHHLVSAVRGTLKEKLNAVDLLRATFPGGSITGAPKIRAMEIIAELEPTFRGPYCGCIGYIGFDGNMDSAITIRTFAIKDNVVTFQAGGGIVADSDPQMEYQETLTKAAALFTALTGSN